MRDVANGLTWRQPNIRHREMQLPRPFLVGWSFGSDLALMYGDPSQVEGLVLISPPLRQRRWQTCSDGTIRASRY